MDPAVKQTERAAADFPPKQPGVDYVQDCRPHRPEPLAMGSLSRSPLAAPTLRAA